MNAPKISVIVPVYNVEKYLRRCIESILSQTFTDFEVLLIDDGSNDRSGEICDEYAKKDGRIRVFHKENGGVSSARNVGLDHASGEWIYFMDSDDVIYDNGLFIFNKYISESVDMVMAGFEILNEDNIIIESVEFNDECKIVQVDTFLKNLYFPADRHYKGFLWNKIFRHSVLEQHSQRFNPQIYYNEDRLFIFEYVCLSGKPIACSDIIIYKYYVRHGSAMDMVISGSKYNPLFLTDLTAFYLMKRCLLKSPYASIRLKMYANRGIYNSYLMNIRLMKSKRYVDSNRAAFRKKVIDEIGLGWWCCFVLRSILSDLKNKIINNIGKH